jgi:hypothetical protein
MYSKKVDTEDIILLHEQIESRKKILQEYVDEYLKNKENSLEDRKEVYDKYYTGLLPFEYV